MSTLSKHSRLLITKVDEDGNDIPIRFQQFSFTKVNPWTVRARNRAANKARRQARKHNR